MISTRFRTLLVGLIVLVGAVPVSACPFCSLQGTTLTGDVNQASMVLFGTMGEAKLDPNGEFGQGTTKFKIETVIKKHEFLGNQTEITLPRYVPQDDKGAKTKYLLFCDVFKGKIDPYRGVPVKADSDIVKYLQGALAIKDKDAATRLRYSFGFLDNADLEVSNDAYKEFGAADYKDYREVAKTLPPDRIGKWLEDPNTPSFRFGTYGFLLGHCGAAKDADLLRKLLDDPKKRLASGVDGVLAGYVLLKPKEGFDYVLNIVKDPKKDFLYRYAALRAIRTFWDLRPDVVSKSELLKGIEPLLDQGDIADLAIEDLRKWKCWEPLERVLALAGKESHDVPIVQRSILRYALSCKDNAKAKAFVADMRKKDAEKVQDAEELLKLEEGTK